MHITQTHKGVCILLAHTRWLPHPQHLLTSFHLPRLFFFHLPNPAPRSLALLWVSVEDAGSSGKWGLAVLGRVACCSGRCVCAGLINTKQLHGVQWHRERIKRRWSPEPSLTQELRKCKGMQGNLKRLWPMWVVSQCGISQMWEVGIACNIT